MSYQVQITRQEQYQPLANLYKERAASKAAAKLEKMRIHSMMIFTLTLMMKKTMKGKVRLELSDIMLDLPMMTFCMTLIWMMRTRNGLSSRGSDSMASAIRLPGARRGRRRRNKQHPKVMLSLTVLLA